VWVCLGVCCGVLPPPGAGIPPRGGVGVGVFVGGGGGGREARESVRDSVCVCVCVCLQAGQCY